MRMSWDWNSWLSNIALRQILAKSAHGGALDRARPYEQGWVLNFLEFGGIDGTTGTRAAFISGRPICPSGVDNDPCT